MAAIPDKSSIRLTAQQMATMLVLDSAMAFLQIGANQLGGWLELKKEADILVGAIEFIGTRKMALQKEWANAVVIAGANDLRLVK